MINITMFIIPSSLRFLVLILLGNLAHPALAFDEINKSFIGSVALGGYDAVSYFTVAKALPGDKIHAVNWKGATWLFSSEVNRQRFKSDPEAFAPQYGGHCSNQMSLGNLSDIDPTIWRMIDGKLYLFGHDAGKTRWASKTRRRVREADEHWRNFVAR